ncbi:hypothetical protein NFC81_15550 [Salinispirillum sp. LH 10-3-1]|uniref:Uncharacterized protein n=1 Tax=Salinispirillum sp. LH 10-3-1 TaxID=2952525 RepID=A0AB38YGB3_9GAMM
MALKKLKEKLQRKGLAILPEQLGLLLLEEAQWDLLRRLPGWEQIIGQTMTPYSTKTSEGLFSLIGCHE